MATLKKATLQEIKADASAAPLGPEIAVQFNPASLKLDLANQVEGGDTYGKQARQYLGKTSTTLSFDLHFDTADQGSTDAPVSVRTLTAQVERFLLPKGEGNTKQAPPKCRFHWDELVIDGIIESVSIDFDLFAANGTPLRAKMGVSIKEQDAKYELLQSGPGANTAGSASLPGVTVPTGGADRSADALAGESVADFAARMGLDPSAWRAIADGLGATSSLSLSAGVSIDFSSSLSAGAGVGVKAGVEAGATASLHASFGLDSGASSAVSPSAAAASAGLALTAAGGVSAALESVATVQAESAAGDARRAFGSAVPSASTSSAGASASVTAVLPSTSTPKPSMPDQTRTPLQLSGMPSPSTRASAPGAPAAPAADPRATTFGFGVPLKPRATVTAATTSSDPSAAPWTRVSSGSNGTSSGLAPAKRSPARPCGCRGARHHGAHTCR